MKHRVKGRKLKRTSSHRKAMMSNLSASLIKNQRIHTTEAKAKELRIYIEPLVTKAKKALANGGSDAEANVHYRRLAKKFLGDDEAVKILFETIAPKTLDRQGGYTRVLKTGHRQGDGGDTAIIEFVDFTFIKEKKVDETTDAKGKVKDKPKKEDTKGTETKTEKKVKAKKTEEKPKKTTKKKEAEEETTKEKKPRKKKTAKQDA